jgi:hypothetical protein
MFGLEKTQNKWQLVWDLSLGKALKKKSLLGSWRKKWRTNLFRKKELARRILASFF